MEDIFTIKVKSKPDKKNVYPSEKRYSASTVSGLAWVHIALAATSFVLACLAIIHPTGGGMVTQLSPTETIVTSVEAVDAVELLDNVTMETDTHSDFRMNVTDTISHKADEYSCILILAPSMLTVSSLAAGIASIMASSHWYIDRNITWLFLMSVLSSTVALISFVMIITWIASMNGIVLSKFYTEEPFDDYILVPRDSAIEKNSSHLIVQNESPVKGMKEHLITKRVLSINIVIACFLEFLWSLLSLKISYKGMKTEYKDDDTEQKGSHIEVVTKFKGNKRAQPTPDLIVNYQSNKIKQVLDDNYYQDSKPEINSEYRERMNNYLNRCSSFDSDSVVQSVASEIPEMPERETVSRNTTISWGDGDQGVYNQNNLDLSTIIKDRIRRDESKVVEARKSENDKSE